MHNTTNDHTKEHPPTTQTKEQGCRCESVEFEHHQIFGVGCLPTYLTLVQTTPTAHKLLWCCGL